ncbi:MAG: helix-turn-helix domain-containing protein [Myxococcales bacterium]|nr:helix-turn-helix domain-containing protein [Myxococcales bacterium]
MANERLFTVPEIARKTGVSPKRIRFAVAEGHLRACDLGTRWLRIRGSDFERWMAATQVRPPAPTHPLLSETKP